MTNFTVAMIVKNEQDNIATALNSTLPFDCNYVVIDTGSTDDTLDLLTDWFFKNNKEHFVMQENFTDFADMRSLVLERSRYYGNFNGYTLMLDADDVIESLDAKKLDQFAGKDAYRCTMSLNNVTYGRVCIFKNSKLWEYKGVTHEFPYCAEPTDIGRSVGTIKAGVHGYRSRDPLKYIHDADTINKALMIETDTMMRGRYCFYLAQSYRDALHSGAAIYWYKIVAGNDGNWSEERYVACLNLARLTGDLDWYVKAIGINQQRAEAYVALGFPKLAAECTVDKDWLFVEQDAYDGATQT